MDENKLKKNIKSSFSKMSASEEIKKKTKLYIEDRTGNYGAACSVRPDMNLVRYASCIIACIFVLLFGGYELYFSTVASISIDINPSIELGINRVGQVISVNGYNEDGIFLANQLDLKYKSYHEAVLEMMQNKTISALIEQNEILCIGIIGEENETTSKMVQKLQDFVEKKENVECYFEKKDKVKKAHASGLSYGKYKAYLECKMVDDSITIEDIQAMTMREIRQHISSCMGRGNCDKNEKEQENCKEQGNRKRKGKWKQ